MKHILLLLFILGFSNTSISAVCAKLLQAKGRVEILRLEEASSKEEVVRHAIIAKKRDRVLCTDVIVTARASRVKIRFKNKAVMTMGPNSRISIYDKVKKSGDSSLINLTYGKVRTFFKKKKSSDKKMSMRIKTPSAVVGVRGTDFYTSFDPNHRVTEQATLKGEVEVTQRATKKKVIVEKGQQVKVEEAPKEKKGTLSEPIKPKPMIVKPIEKAIAQEIRQTSVLVKKDKAFTSKEAVAVLGKPNTWKPPIDELPLDLKNIKEEF